MDFDNIKWTDFEPEEELTNAEIADAIDRCVCLLNQNPHSPASAIGLGELFIKVERMMNPVMYRVLQGRITQFGFIPPDTKRKPEKDYDPDYIEFLRSDPNTTYVADLIEGIKKAQVSGFKDGQFTKEASKDILERMHRIIPATKDLIQNDSVKEMIAGCLKDAQL